MDCLGLRYLEWAQHREQSGLSVRTLQDQEKYLKKVRAGVRLGINR